jgi:hypothetical protein
LRKTIFAALLILAAHVPQSEGIVLRAGLNYGPQKIQDAKMRAVYGETNVFLPSFEVQFWKGLTVGAEYEFGYDRSGKIGMNELASSFRMEGWDAYLGYEQRLGEFALLAKIGLGRFSYKQTIPGLDVSGTKVDGVKTTVTFAAGAKFYPAKFLFLTAAVRYVPLKVKPLEAEVDLGGIRYMAGMGLAFDIR